MDRRSLLTGVGGIGLVALAGCAELSNSAAPSSDDDDDEDEPTGTPTPGFRASFEGQSLPPSLVDVSEKEAPPMAFSTEHANRGMQSLVLSSKPGTTTRARVSGKRALRMPASTKTMVKQLGEQDSQSVVGLTLTHARTAALVKIHVSPYHGAARLVGRNSTTGADPTYETRITDADLGEGWTRLSLEVSDGEVVGSVGESTASIPVPTPMPDSEVYPSIDVNGWGGGGSVATAFDGFSASQR